MATAPDKAKLDADFSELYKAHLKDVYSYAYYRVGNHHDAEDLTEQTFLQAYRHFARAQEESKGRPLRPWLIRIAHNLAANYYRDRSRRPQTNIDDAGALSTPHTTEGLVQDRDDLARILRGVQQLPDDRREALIMRFALGMDNKRDRAGARPHRRGDQGVDPSSHPATRGHRPGRRQRLPEVTDVSTPFPDIEARLRDALAPVDPPIHLQQRLETTLDSIVELAADELEAWELEAIKDPRNWPRAAVGPAAAVVVGGGAAVGLVLLRTQRRRHKRRAAARGARDLFARTLKDAGREALKVFDDLAPHR